MMLETERITQVKNEFPHPYIDRRGGEERRRGLITGGEKRIYAEKQGLPVIMEPQFINAAGEGEHIVEAAIKARYGSYTVVPWTPEVSKNRAPAPLLVAVNKAQHVQQVYEARNSDLAGYQGTDFATCDIVLRIGNGPQSVILNKPEDWPAREELMSVYGLAGLTEQPVYYTTGVAAGQIGKPDLDLYLMTSYCGTLNNVDMGWIYNLLVSNGHRTGGIDVHQLLNNMTKPNQIQTTIQRMSSPQIVNDGNFYVVRNDLQVTDQVNFNTWIDASNSHLYGLHSRGMFPPVNG